jgi:hypothetical protein
MTALVLIGAANVWPRATLNRTYASASRGDIVAMEIFYAPNLMAPDSRLSSLSIPVTCYNPAAPGEPILPIPGFRIPEVNKSGSAFYLRIDRRVFLVTNYHNLTIGDAAFGFKPDRSGLAYRSVYLWGTPPRHLSIESRQLVFVPTENGEAADVVLIEVGAHEISASAAILDDGFIPNTIDLALAAREPAHVQWNSSRLPANDGQPLLVCGYPIDRDQTWPAFQATRAIQFPQIGSGRPAEDALLGDIRPGFSGGPVVSAATSSGLRLVGVTCRGSPVVINLTDGTSVQTYGGNFVRLDAILERVLLRQS